MPDYADDTESLYQVLTRRLSHLEDDDISGVEEADPRAKQSCRTTRARPPSASAAASPTGPT